jgi:uncharacterized SAM-binding protein YcdF (DUF218 family)
MIRLTPRSDRQMSDRQRGGIISRLLSLIFLVVFIFLLYLARHPLLRLAGNWWVVSDPLQHADAIVVIGDDNYSGDRAAYGAELFLSGWAPRVVASGRMMRPYSGVAALIAHDIESKGVPAASVVTFDHHAANTREEAEALRGFVGQHNWHKIVLVTSSYHTRRSRYIFRKVFPLNVSVIVTPARDSEYDPDRWWESRLGVKLFFQESVGYLLAMWELRNSQPPTQSARLVLTNPAWAGSRLLVALVPSRPHFRPMCNHFQFTIASHLYYIHRPGPQLSTRGSTA